MSLESDVEDLKAWRKKNETAGWGYLAYTFLAFVLFAGIFGSLLAEHKALKQEVNQLRYKSAPRGKE